MNFPMRLAAVAGLLACLALGACAERSYIALNVSVGPPPLVENAEPPPATTYKVDILGISDETAPEFENINPSEWFASSGPWAKKRAEYRGAIRTMQVRSGGSPQVFRRSESIWNSWRVGRVNRLRVIADPPTGAPDSSVWIRDIEPMTGTWADNEVKIWVDAGGVKLDRAPLTEK